MRKLLITSLFLLATVAHAAVIYPVPESNWEKIKRCHVKVRCYFEINLGTTITTINGTDTLSSSRSVINTNFSNLNTGKIEVGTSSVNSITSLSGLTSAPALTTIGTITSGIWNSTAISVLYGGTGTTSPSANQIILGDTTNGFKVVGGLGSSGQFLTSNGAGVPPTWQTGAIDQTANYNFTGTTFRVKNLVASSTIANPITLNGLTFSTQTTRTASSTVLAENGSGNLSFQTLTSLGMPYMIAATTTNSSDINTSTEVQVATFSTAIPGGLMGTNGAVELTLYMSNFSETVGNNAGTLKVKLGGTTVCTLTTTVAAVTSGSAFARFFFYNNASASSNNCLGEMTGANNAGSIGGNDTTVSEDTGNTIDTGTAQTVTVTYTSGQTDQTFTVGSAKLMFMGRN